MPRAIVIPAHRPEVVTLGSPLTQSTYEIPFLLSYEPDLFGKDRRTLEASNASLQATAADMYNVNLVLTAELAADYFSLRELDAETQVVQESVDIQQKGLQLVENRHTGGVASGLDLAQQQTLLDSTVTQLYLVQQQRAQFEHAIAVLTGNPASTFSVPVAPLHATPPPVPLGVPSDLLERRPDVATAERQMAFENAEVGVATAAFYPQLTLSGVRRLSEHRHHQPDQRSQRDLVARRRSCCSRSFRADAIAPTWRPPRLPMTSRSPTIARPC